MLTEKEKLLQTCFCDFLLVTINALLRILLRKYFQPIMNMYCLTLVPIMHHDYYYSDEAGAAMGSKDIYPKYYKHLKEAA